MRFKNFFRTSFLILFIVLFLLPSYINSAAVDPRPKPPAPPPKVETPPPPEVPPQPPVTPQPPEPPPPPTTPPAEQPLTSEIKNIPEPINIQPIEQIAKPDAAVNKDTLRNDVEWMPQDQTFVLYLFVIPLPDQYVLFMDPINWSSPMSDYIETISITEYVWGTPTFEPSNNMICPASDHTHWQTVTNERTIAVDSSYNLMAPLITLYDMDIRKDAADSERAPRWGYAPMNHSNVTVGIFGMTDKNGNYISLTSELLIASNKEGNQLFLLNKEGDWMFFDTNENMIKGGRIEKDDEGELSLADKQENELDFNDSEEQLASRDVDPNSQYSGLPTIEDAAMPPTIENTSAPDAPAVETDTVEATPPPAEQPPETVEPPPVAEPPAPEPEVAVAPVETPPPPSTVTETPVAAEPSSNEDSWLKTFHENNDKYNK
ncbi:MAG: hypothetical protein A3G85_02145 [Elusimicrobia bacterium RIFCSPLOWO2_12_FULL_39_28]|nr:MAG: hypothetical protein A3G85_02145 [Elusimicrobia bacterium RIFCSPLOWO2_12_FULL_39_28]